MLSDPEKRRRYEQFGQYWNQAGGMGGGAAPGMDVDFGRYGNFDDFINDLLGRFGGPAGGGSRGVDFQEDSQGAVFRVVARLHALRSISMPKHR